MNSDSLLKSVPAWINIASSYDSIIDKLRVPNLNPTSSHLLEIFFGWPVTIGHKRHWLRPVFFKWFSVHILYLNCSPDTPLNPRVTYLRSDDIAYKIAEHVIDSTSPQIIIRQCLSGNIVFPNIVDPTKNAQMTLDDFRELRDYLWLGNWWEQCELSDVSEYHQLSTLNSEGVHHVREYSLPYKDSNLFVADFVLDDDPWIHYQLISRHGVQEYLKSNKRWTVVRIDSWCDSGQIYWDEACDCREQLHCAIDSIMKDDGIIVHIPTQDGRWYGCVPKMETEWLKEWLLMKTNQNDVRKLDTVEAGKYLFWENYDIRTFDWSWRVLRALWLDSIVLLTNNRRKIWEIVASGIEVVAQDSSVHKPSCERHTKAKYDSPLYLPVNANLCH